MGIWIFISNSQKFKQIYQHGKWHKDLWDDDGQPFWQHHGSIIELWCGGGFNTWRGGLITDNELTIGGGDGFN